MATKQEIQEAVEMFKQELNNPEVQKNIAKVLDLTSPYQTTVGSLKEILNSNPRFDNYAIRFDAGKNGNKVKTGAEHVSVFGIGNVVRIDKDNQIVYITNLYD